MGVIIVILLVVLLLYVLGFVFVLEIVFFFFLFVDLSEIEEGKYILDRCISVLLNDFECLLVIIFIFNNFVNVIIIMLCNYFFVSIIYFGNFVILEFLLIMVVFIFLLLFFGEIMFKIYLVQNMLKFCCKVVFVIFFLKKFFLFLLVLLVCFFFLVNRCVVKKNYNIFVDEFLQVLELMDKSEILEESNILEGIICFGEEMVKEVMIFWLDMVDLEINIFYFDVLKCIVENVYFCILVYVELWDNIKGIFYIKDLFFYLGKGDNFCWQILVCFVYFVFEMKMIDDFLCDFQVNKIYIVIVVDEFGGILGIVIMEDIIEEIVGEINDEYDDEECMYVKLNDCIYIFEVKILLFDFYKIMKVDFVFFEKVEGDVDILVGLLLEIKGEFFVLYEWLDYGNYYFEVFEMNMCCILKVKVIVDFFSFVEEEKKQILLCFYIVFILKGSFCLEYGSLMK